MPTSMAKASSTNHHITRNRIPSVSSFIAGRRTFNPSVIIHRTVTVAAASTTARGHVSSGRSYTSVPVGYRRTASDRRGLVATSASPSPGVGEGSTSATDSHTSPGKAPPVHGVLVFANNVFIHHPCGVPPATELLQAVLKNMEAAGGAESAAASIGASCSGDYMHNYDVMMDAVVDDAQALVVDEDKLATGVRGPSANESAGGEGPQMTTDEETQQAEPSKPGVGDKEKEDAGCPESESGVCETRTDWILIEKPKEVKYDSLLGCPENESGLCEDIASMDGGDE